MVEISVALAFWQNVVWKYSHLSNSQNGGAKVPELINEEEGINEEGINEDGGKSKKSKNKEGRFCEKGGKIFEKQ